MMLFLLFLHFLLFLEACEALFSKGFEDNCNLNRSYISASHCKSRVHLVDIVNARRDLNHIPFLFNPQALTAQPTKHVLKKGPPHSSIRSICF